MTQSNTLYVGLDVHKDAFISILYNRLSSPQKRHGMLTARLKPLFLHHCARQHGFRCCLACPASAFFMDGRRAWLTRATTSPR